MEDVRRIVNVWIEHRVQIDVHQVHKILVVGAGNGIDCLVRVGHGV